MPQTWQEWLALAIVAFTIGLLLGRWLVRHRQRRGQAKQAGPKAACGDCPQQTSPPKRFKNIPINLDKSSD